MGAHIHVHPNGRTLNLPFCFSFYRYGLIRRTAANRPHRNFTSPHTDGPSPLPATLLTLGLWLDGSIIIPVYASSPHKLCATTSKRNERLPAVRLDIDRKYRFALAAWCFATLSLSKNKGCQPVKKSLVTNELL